MSQAGTLSSSSGVLPPTVPLAFITDDGTVIAAANIVNVNGMAGIEVIANPTGSNNMIVRNETGPPNVNLSNFYYDFLTNLELDVWFFITGGTAEVTNGSNSHPGIFQFTAGSGDTDLFLNDNFTNTAPIVLGTNNFYMNWIVRLQSLSAMGNEYTFYCGVGDTLSLSAPSTPINGVYFSYTNTVNSGNFVVNTISSFTGMNTSQNTSIAATTDYINFGINVLNQQASFIINGTVVGGPVIITDIPVVPITPFLYLSNISGSTPVMDVDLCAFNLYLNPNR